MLLTQVNSWKNQEIQASLLSTQHEKRLYHLLSSVNAILDYTAQKFFLLRDRYHPANYTSLVLRNIRINHFLIEGISSRTYGALITFFTQTLYIQIVWIIGAFEQGVESWKEFMRKLVQYG